MTSSRKWKIISCYWNRQTSSPTDPCNEKIIAPVQIKFQKQGFVCTSCRESSQADVRLLPTFIFSFFFLKKCTALGSRALSRHGQRTGDVLSSYSLSSVVAVAGSWSEEAKGNTYISEHRDALLVMATKKPILNRPRGPLFPHPNVKCPMTLCSGLQYCQQISFHWTST